MRIGVADRVEPADGVDDVVRLLRGGRVVEPDQPLSGSTLRQDRCQSGRGPMAPATWKRHRTTINSFYDRSVQTELLRRRPYFRKANGRDALSWGCSRC